MGFNAKKLDERNNIFYKKKLLSTNGNNHGKTTLLSMKCTMLKDERVISRKYLILKRLKFC